MDVDQPFVSTKLSSHHTNTSSQPASVWHSAVQTLITAIEEVLLDEGGNYSNPVANVSWRLKRKSIDTNLNNSTDAFPIPGELPSKRKRQYAGSTLPSRDSKAQKLSNTLSSQFARSVKMSDAEDSDEDDAVCNNNNKIPQQARRPHHPPFHFTSQIQPMFPLLASSSLDVNCGTSTDLLEFSTPTSQGSSQSSSASSLASIPSSYSFQNATSPNSMSSSNSSLSRDLRKISRAPRSSGDIRASAGSPCARPATHDIDMSGGTVDSANTETRQRSFQPPMPTWARLVAIRQGEITINAVIGNPSMALRPPTGFATPMPPLAHQFQHEIQTVLSALLNRSGCVSGAESESFGEIKRLVDCLVRCAEVLGRAGVDLVQIMPEWPSIERSVENVVQYVKVYEDMHATIQTVFRTPASADSIDDYVRNLNFVMSEKRRLYGDLLRQDGLAWKVLGLPVDEAVLEDTRQWIVETVAAAVQVMWQVVDGRKGEEDVKLMKIVLTILQTTSECIDLVGAPHDQLTIASTMLAMLYANWCVSEFDRKFRESDPEGGFDKAKEQGKGKGRVVVEGKIMGLFESVVRCISFLKTIRDGDGDGAITLPGGLHHHHHHHHNHHHHHHHHHAKPKLRRNRQYQTFNFARPNSVSSDKHPPTLTNSGPEDDAMVMSTIAADLQLAMDGFAGSLVEAGLRLCEHAACLRSKNLASGHGSGGGRSGGGGIFGLGGLSNTAVGIGGTPGYVVIYFEFVVKFAKKVSEFAGMEEDVDRKLHKLYGCLESIESGHS